MAGLAALKKNRLRAFNEYQAQIKKTGKYSAQKGQYSQCRILCIKSLKF